MLMRSPQIGTFATPGTRIRRVLIFQYVVIDRSIRSSSGSVVVSPIFMTRLVADSGWIMKGGLAHVGSCGEICAMRSATCCRAVNRSVPGLKIISTDDSDSTDFERMSSSPGTPFRVCSSGIVTSCSTWFADRPKAGVWTSTFGGANSGKTSTAV